MKAKLIFLFFLFFICPELCIHAKSTDPRELFTIDSLKRALSTAKYDTTKIRLRYLIGRQEQLYRVSYWDSIAVDARKYNLPYYVFKALLNKGVSYAFHDSTLKSIECLNQSLRIAESNRYKPEMLLLYANLNVSYGSLPDIGKALDANYRGLRLAEELHNKTYILSFTNAIGSYYYSLGNADKALEIHLNCLRIAREMKSDVDIAGILLDIGSDYRLLDDTEKSIHYYMESQKYMDELGKSEHTVEILNSVGAAWQMKHRLDSAAWYFSKAYDMSVFLHSQGCMASCLASMSGNSYLKGDYKLAEKQAIEGLNISKSIKFTRQIPNLAKTLKRIYEKEGKYAEALKAYELYVSSNDSIANEQTRNQASEKEFAYTFEKKENENKLLGQRNQIQTLQLNRNKYLVFGLTGTLILAVIIFCLYIQHNRLNTERHKMHLEQKLLRSQMNPHFIFNSLQAIQNYILNHDAREAVRYLSSFASLTRNVLENSRMEYISLKKEITLLENYLQLQKLRFGNRFSYNIRVDEKIDTERVMIPPMLAQPFIENAIKHGMHDIDSGGEIEVAYNTTDGLLLMEIRDNGYGIKQTGNAGKEHQSLAMEITMERVALMNKKERRKTTCRISDAFPLASERNGVRVDFSLPLHLSS